ncbi:MAG: glutathione S-transferase family protein [Alphaproteobacteria bacterium]|nr:glutathione S-transferase family protein [Alphaproteobacteria bacterium]
MADIILHHYPTSPYAEKVRLAFGIKGLTWKSVIIPNIMPKPDLMPLTGGYRKTPVMQIGADIFCDTQIIMRELDRRFAPMPLMPAGLAGIAEALSFWADRTLFWAAVGVVMGQIADQLPDAFKKDRSAFSGRDFDAAALKKTTPFARDQLYASLSHAEAMLADKRPYLLGEQPTLADVAVYNPVWFVRQRLSPAAPPMDRLPLLGEWATRMTRFGHGVNSELSGPDALEIARAASPDTPAGVDANDPSGLKAGASVAVTPDDTGKIPVKGQLATLNAHEIAVRRTDEKAGELVVHFPRAGYVVTAA